MLFNWLIRSFPTCSSSALDRASSSASCDLACCSSARTLSLYALLFAFIAFPLSDSEILYRRLSLRRLSPDLSSGLCDSIVNRLGALLVGFDDNRRHSWTNIGCH